jgi:predicted DNA-binding protein (MmcQ/YjbR family)
LVVRDVPAGGALINREPVYQRLREICLALPEAVEKPFGGHTAPAFRVRDKMFAGCGERDFVVTMKGAPGAQEVLVGADPDRFFVPAYVGSKGWIGIRLDGDVDWGTVEDLIRESYRMVAPKLLAKLV